MINDNEWQWKVIVKVVYFQSCTKQIELLGKYMATSQQATWKENSNGNTTLTKGAEVNNHAQIHGNMEFFEKRWAGTGCKVHGENKLFTTFSRIETPWPILLRKFYPEFSLTAITFQLGSAGLGLTSSQNMPLKFHIVEDTERTRFCPQTGRRTDGQGETSSTPFQLHWSGGIINSHFPWKVKAKNAQLDYKSFHFVGTLP